MMSLCAPLWQFFLFNWAFEVFVLSGSVDLFLCDEPVYEQGDEFDDVVCLDSVGPAT